MFVDPWTDTSKDDHLDERIRLAADGTDTQQDITETVASGDTAKPAMIPAVHIQGKITYQRLDGTIVNAKGAVVSYTNSSTADPYPGGWDTDDDITHGYGYVLGDDGMYSLKVKKGADTNGA